MILKKSGRDLDHKDELRQTRQIIVLRLFFLEIKFLLFAKLWMPLRRKKSLMM